ncbi:unnamed protein product, partial [Didymodactylos carnosus]
FYVRQGKENKIKQVNKIDWSLLKNHSNRSLLELNKKLIKFRRRSNALRSDNIEIFHENLDNKLFAYTRWTENDKRVVVVLNFSKDQHHGYKVTHWPSP